MENENKKIQTLSTYDDLSKFSDNVLSSGGFNELLEQYFNENDAKKFTINLKMAISKTLSGKSSQDFKECVQDKKLKYQLCNSLIKIIKYGAIINTDDIYFCKFGGSQLTCGFNLQYQAEVKILESNGFLNIQTGYVLKEEDYKLFRENNKITLNHIPNMEKRLNNAKDLIKDVLFGYAVYTHNGIDNVFIVDNDILMASYNLSNAKTDKWNKENLKWKFKKAIDITIIHALFRNLVLKDWDSEEYEENIKDVNQDNFITPEQAKEIRDLISMQNSKTENDIIQAYKIEYLEKLSKDKFTSVVNRLKSIINEQN